MERLKRKLAAAADMPEGAFGACQDTEIEGNSSVRICGCREIISYGSEKAEIAVTGMNVTVCGENLMIETFGGGTVRLSGVIGSVSLSDGKGKEKC